MPACSEKPELSATSRRAPSGSPGSVCSVNSFCPSLGPVAIRYVLEAPSRLLIGASSAGRNVRYAFSISRAMSPERSSERPIRSAIRCTSRLSSAEVGSGHTARTCQAGLADQMPRDRAIDDAEHLRDDLGPGREQIAQRKRQRQHPLADRLARQDIVHEQRGRLGHPPSAAARTEAAALAAERNQLLSLTRLALDPQKPVLESPTLQIRLKLVLDIARQRPLLGRAPIPELRIVLGHEPIEQRRLRPVPRISWRRDKAGGLRNVAVRQAHAVRPCTASTA